MNFLNAISLKGRLRRKYFIFAFLAAVALFLAMIGIFQVTHIGAIFAMRHLVIVALIPPAVRRLHDINLSGWFAIIAFVVPLFFIPLLVLPGIPGTNKFGEDPKAQLA